MIRKFKYYKFIIFSVSILLLSGCFTHFEESSAPVVRLETNKKAQSSSKTISTNMSPTSETLQQPLTGYSDQTVQLMPKFYYRDWNKIIQLMINKMLQELNTNPCEVLLVDDINNCTNSFLETTEATKNLRLIIKDSNRFSLVSLKQILMAKRQLGLSPKDNLFGSRSKIIGIARKTRAKYLLYSSVINNNDLILLQMQLILVRTGEILWSDRSFI